MCASLSAEVDDFRIRSSRWLSSEIDRLYSLFGQVLRGAVMPCYGLKLFQNRRTISKAAWHSISRSHSSAITRNGLSHAGGGGANSFGTSRVARRSKVRRRASPQRGPPSGTPLPWIRCLLAISWIDPRARWSRQMLPRQNRKWAQRKSCLVAQNAICLWAVFLNRSVTADSMTRAASSVWDKAASCRSRFAKNSW